MDNSAEIPKLDNNNIRLAEEQQAALKRARFEGARNVVCATIGSLLLLGTLLYFGSKPAHAALNYVQTLANGTSPDTIATQPTPVPPLISIAPGDVIKYAPYPNIRDSNLLNFTNRERQAAGVAPLKLNPKLNQAATDKAKDMFTNNYWSHTDKNGNATWYLIQDAGYDYGDAGENLFRETDTNSNINANTVNAAIVIDGWKKSPKHRKDMLDPTYKDVGFGVFEGIDTRTDEAAVLVVAEYADIWQNAPQ